jgi:hypothetical protein
MAVSDVRDRNLLDQMVVINSCGVAKWIREGWYEDKRTYMAEDYARLKDNNNNQGSAFHEIDRLNTMVIVSDDPEEEEDGFEILSPPSAFGRGSRPANLHTPRLHPPITDLIW